MNNKCSLVINDHHQDQITSDQDHRYIYIMGPDQGDLTAEFRSSIGDDPAYDHGTVMSSIKEKNLKVPENRTSQIVKNMSRAQHGRSYRDVLVGERQ